MSVTQTLLDQWPSLRKYVFVSNFEVHPEEISWEIQDYKLRPSAPSTEWKRHNKHWPLSSEWYFWSIITIIVTVNLWLTILDSGVHTKPDIIYDVSNRRDVTTFSFINHVNSALHVSGDKFAHSQERFLSVYTAFGTMHRSVHCTKSCTCTGARPATSSVHYTTNCNTQSSAPEDGQNNGPKHVELTGIINKPLLLHLVSCLYYLYQWCTVKQISDNEIYLLIK